MFVFLVSAVSGCANSVAGTSQPPCSHFDPDTAGAINGRVIWSGDAPAAEPFSYRFDPGLGDDAATLALRRNCYLPAISPHSRGVRDAVVFLQGVDPQRARPWDHKPVRVEQRDLQMHVIQGECDSRVGFVRRGDTIEMVSCDSRFHALHASGAAWFTLAFSDPYQPLSRPMKQNGVVELTSGAGHYWMRAFVFVDQHPYYTRTDENGRFELKQVSPGRYHLVSWLPDWREAGHDRDPDTGLVTRLRFGAPLVAEQSVEMAAHQSVDIEIDLGVHP
jgi:hypothetical protein